MKSFRAGSACFLVLFALFTALDRLHGAPFNIAPDGDAILGAGADLFGSNDIPLQNSGSVVIINDQYVAPPGFFNIRTGESVDSFGSADNQFDFVGIMFDVPQNGVSSVRVQNFAANDGGWWGESLPTQNGAPLAASDLVAPEVQVTTNGGATWTTIASTTDYVDRFTGVIRGTGVPTSSATPFATFNFAPQNGVNGVRLIGNAGGEADGSGFIGLIEMEVLQDTGVVFPTLDINTATGALTLKTGAGTARGIQGYTIASENIGALDPTKWLSVSDNYDVGNGGANQIDANDAWTELSGSSVMLSESQFGGDGGLLNANRNIPLGNAWIRNPFGEDIRMEILLPDGRTRRVDVTYNGQPGNPLEIGDLNFDGSINALDWPIVRDNFNTDVSGLSAAEAYVLGDLNGDGFNDEHDFSQFKSLYDAANGAGAFQVMLSGSVPEPGSFAALGLGLATLAFRYRARKA